MAPQMALVVADNDRCHEYRWLKYWNRILPSPLIAAMFDPNETGLSISIDLIGTLAFRSVILFTGIFSLLWLLLSLLPDAKT